jgi:hypothetical protein
MDVKVVGKTWTYDAERLLWTCKSTKRVAVLLVGTDCLC